MLETTRGCSHMATPPSRRIEASGLALLLLEEVLAIAH